MRLNFITCGESHGKYLAVILEGMPAGLTVDLSLINRELARRQQGYGRGGRQKIEKDEVEILGGVIGGKTTGAPQWHWFGPAGHPASAGIGTPEAIQLVWASHREIIKDWGEYSPAI